MNRLIPNIVVAAVMIALAAVLVWARRVGLIDHPGSERAFMAALGLMVAAYANIIPKKSPAVSASRLAVRRLAGWALTLAGLAYAALWAFAPIAIAPDLSAAVLFVAVASVLAWCFWGRARAA